MGIAEARGLLKWPPVRRLALAVWVATPAVALAQPAPPPDQPAPAPVPAPAPAPAPDQPPAPQPEPPQEQPAEPPPSPAIKVRGRVINALGRPVRNATIGLETDPALAHTDRTGHFIVKAPMGATLVIDADGYSTGLATVTGDILDDIVLLDTKTATETIEVKGEAPAAAPGAAQLDRQELQRVP